MLVMIWQARQNEYSPAMALNDYGTGAAMATSIALACKIAPHSVSAIGTYVIHIWVVVVSTVYDFML